MEKKEKTIGNMTIQELRKIINKEVNKILIRAMDDVLKLGGGRI